MRDAVLQIASLSLSGGILALVLLALRPLMGRLSRSFGYYLWLIVLLRLVLPVTLEANLVGAAFGAMEAQAARGRVADVQENARAGSGAGAGAVGASAGDSAKMGINGLDRTRAADPGVNGAGHSAEANAAKPANGAAALQGAPDSRAPSSSLSPAAYPSFPGSIWNLLFLVWLAGALAALGWGTAGYLRFVHALKAANRPAAPGETALLRELSGSLRVEAHRNPRVHTPMLVGLFRPRILLPDVDYDPESLRMVLLHELTHLRRGDIALRWLAQIVFAMHWFNPLLILARREMNRACELACDEAVVAGLDLDARRRYGEMLLRAVSEGRAPKLSKALVEEKRTLRERLSSIMTVRKRGWRTTAASSALLAIVMVSALALGACTAGEGTAAGEHVENTENTGNRETTENTDNTESTSTANTALPTIDKDVVNLEGKEMTLEFVRSLASHGDDLRIVHFGDYVQKSVDANGESIKVVMVDKNRQYKFSIPVVGGFRLDVKGAMGDEPVAAATLRRSNEGFGEGIDIRSEVFTALLDVPETSFEMPTVAKPTNLDAIISRAVLKKHAGSFLKGETSAEGHKLLYLEQEADVYRAYILESYGEYGFVQGEFTQVAGMGTVPAIITMKFDGSSGYSVTDFESMPVDANAVEWMKARFPKISQYTQEELAQASEDLVRQKEAYARMYLQHIGSDEEIVRHDDPKDQLLVVLNALTVAFPKHIAMDGGVIYIEDGKSMRYCSQYDSRNSSMTFTKETENGTLVQRTVVSTMDGRILALENYPEWSGTKKP